MSTFNDFIKAFREVCEEKDKEIERLNDRIDGFINEREAIRKAFLNGNYEGLKMYFN